MNHTTPSKNPQQKKYKYRELLTHLQCCTKAPLSYKEQAEIVGCSKFFAKKIAKQNLNDGVITITPTTHESSGRKLAGKNIYGRGKKFDSNIHLLSKVNLDISLLKTRLNINYQTLSKNKSLNQSDLCKNNRPFKHTIIRRFVFLEPNSPKKFTTNKNSKENLDKSKFAKDKQPETSKNYITKDQKIEALKAYGFESYAEKAPIWWFRDPARLKAALRLLKAKLKRGFKPKNFFKFVTFLMKRGTFGYRRHCARKTSVAITRPTFKRIEPFMESDALANGYEALKELHKKHRLDISFTNMQKLARHGYSKLFTVAEVMLKRLKLPGIKDVNAFMHHLISMKEPYDILRKKHA